MDGACSSAAAVPSAGQFGRGMQLRSTANDAVGSEAKRPRSFKSFSGARRGRPLPKSNDVEDRRVRPASVFNISEAESESQGHFGGWGQSFAGRGAFVRKPVPFGLFLDPPRPVALPSADGEEAVIATGPPKTGRAGAERGASWGVIGFSRPALGKSAPDRDPCNRIARLVSGNSFPNGNGSHL